MIWKNQVSITLKRYVAFVKFHFKYTLKFPYFEGLLIFFFLLLNASNLLSDYIASGLIGIYDFSQKSAERLMFGNINILTYPFY